LPGAPQPCQLTRRRRPTSTPCSGPLWLRPLTFLFAQYALFALPLVYAQAAWRNYYVGGGILCAILAVCTWEGSGYYLRTPKVAAGGAPKHKGQ
jgi:hypothetical protein